MATNYDFRNLRVLVVDDSHFMTRVVSNILEALGVGSVYSAHSGHDGFDAACRYRPDVVISDWDMDGGEGPELVNLLRHHPTSPDPFVSVIMLTGFAEMRRVLAARDFGITEFLSKPVSAKALHARLVSLVERPRPFVRVARDYFGPDRRRAANEDYYGADRRGTEDFADIG
ncbi:MAG: response regulator [Alphaproteobacteria bacterium]|nr:response regulator [Alphaproteobacteria bacterium]